MTRHIHMTGAAEQDSGTVGRLGQCASAYETETNRRGAEMERMVKVDDDETLQGRHLLVCWA